MFGVGRDLYGSSSPTLLPKQGHLLQAAQDLVQADLEYLQRRRLHNLPGQPVPVLCHPQSEEVLRICFSSKKKNIFLFFFLVADEVLQSIKASRFLAGLNPAEIVSKSAQIRAEQLTES